MHVGGEILGFGGELQRLRMCSSHGGFGDGKKKRKYVNQGKCAFIKFLFVPLDKIKILTLSTVYVPQQLLYILFLTPFRNFRHFVN